MYIYLVFLTKYFGGSSENIYKKAYLNKEDAKTYISLKEKQYDPHDHSFYISKVKVETVFKEEHLKFYN